MNVLQASPWPVHKIDKLLIAEPIGRIWYVQAWPTLLMHTFYLTQPHNFHVSRVGTQFLLAKMQTHGPCILLCVCVVRAERIYSYTCTLHSRVNVERILQSSTFGEF